MTTKFTDKKDYINSGCRYIVVILDGDDAILFCETFEEAEQACAKLVKQGISLVLITKVISCAEPEIKWTHRYDR